MRFLDEAVIKIKSGDGGRGCVSFRRERFIPKGGPDGGDGGNGGSLIVKGNKTLHTLADYGSSKYFKAPNGEPGRGKNQTGKNGADLILEVPLGAIIQDDDTGELLTDLVNDNQEVVVIPGGKGGKGNKHFATSTNRAPRIAQPGCMGQEKRLRLSLKSLADIGLIGLPNAGKSTLLSRLSMARPKVDSYPFTTLVPNLGVITFDDGRSLVIADVPGLIEGASQGRGLGHRFLKHVERTKLLFHLLDITYQPDQDILEDFHALRREMVAYNPALAQKPQMVLINKMDLYDRENRDLEKLQMALERIGLESLPISALSGEGLEELKGIILGKWKEETEIA
jgi:GTP-binding protein